VTGVFLARHGRTEYNDSERFQGHAPVPLDELGRSQALELAELAAQTEWATFVCSPLARARETAAVVAARIGMEPVIDARFAETDCGDWTHRLFSEVRAESPDEFEAFQRVDRDFCFPGGESYEQQLSRVVEGIEELKAGPLPALVVCHRGVIRLALVAATGDESWRTAQISNGALVEV
jgi:broad specificity phosphatase PhoE